MTDTHDLRNQWYDEPVQYEKPMTEIMKNQEILNALNEKIKAAEESLLYLKQTKEGLEKVIANSAKTPAEEAWKKYWGKYPTNPNEQLWKVFQTGYNDAYYNNAYKEPEDTAWKSVALRFGEKLSDVGPCGYYEFSPDEWFEWALNECFAIKPESEQEEGIWNYDPDAKFRKQEEVKKLQEKEWNYKVTDEKGETNPYKQYLNSVKNLEENNWYVDAKSLVNPSTLYEVCREWCDNDENPPVSVLIDRIEAWLPKEQSANSQNTYVELTVEGFNDCLNQIKSKLR